MSPFVLLDEIHVQVHVPRAMAAADVDSLVEMLGSKRFLLQVVRAVRELFRDQFRRRVRIILVP